MAITTFYRDVSVAMPTNTISSDHRMYEIHLATPEEHRRYQTGWKFSNQLLEDKEFTNKIKAVITRIKEEQLM
jgi:hypothetical protein